MPRSAGDKAVDFYGVEPSPRRSACLVRVDGDEVVVGNALACGIITSAIAMRVGLSWLSIKVTSEATSSSITKK